MSMCQLNALSCDVQAIRRIFPSHSASGEECYTQSVDFWYVLWAFMVEDRVF